MSNFRLNLPTDIPWKLIDCSADMMNTSFCDNKMPTPFRSSIALFAYEPSLEDLPQELCGDAYIFLKVSCSIAGFQPDMTDLQFIYDLHSYGIAEEDLNKLIREFYFGCYGVLLNVSVFYGANSKRTDFPHIVDFEPKNRDFYQSASEFGEVLSGSSNSVSTGKSFGTTFASEDGWSQSSVVASKDDQGSSSDTTSSYGKDSYSDNFTQFGQFQSSQEKRETQSTTTQLSQMYNLLNSYHLGTNRVTFIMLPRPHILQPTNRRVFADGLRVIEGIQEFVLIVQKNKDEAVLRVEVNLETGHFPENVGEIPVDPDADKEIVDTKDFTYTFDTKGGWGGTSENVQIWPPIETANEEWELDESAYQNGVKIVSHELIDGIAESDITESHFHAKAESTNDSGERFINAIFGRYKVEKGWGASAGRIKDKYRVKLKKKKNKGGPSKANPEGLLITARKLCTTLASENRCVRKVERFISPGIVVVDEPPYKAGLLASDHGFYADAIDRIKNILFQSKHDPRRHPSGGVGFLQSKTFQKKLSSILPKDVLDLNVHEVAFIPPGARDKLPMSMTLGELYSIEDSKLRTEFGLRHWDLMPEPRRIEPISEDRS